MNFIIGLVDDEDSQLQRIRRTIKTNAPKDVLYEFKNYELAGTAESLTNYVFEEVIRDIESGCLSLLIIDYKIMIEVTKVEGTDIYQKIQKAVPQFPVIMLTDVIDDCVNHQFIDPDKVYKKSEFFKLEGDYSKEKTTNIFRNMERYSDIRSNLENRLHMLKTRLVDEKGSQELYDELVQTEHELDEYKPLEETQMEKALDSSKVKEIIELLAKTEIMLEGE